MGGGRATNSSLYSLVFVPQMTGGPTPLGLPTEKVSVRHCEASEETTPFAADVTPFFVNTARVLLSLAVAGPVITKLSKSKRS